MDYLLAMAIVHTVLAILYGLLLWWGWRVRRRIRKAEKRAQDEWR